jgi:protein-S-isoprenylcysteine O-methyltransferase Ste14
MSTFAKKFARTGCTSAIRASSIAFLVWLWSVLPLLIVLAEVILLTLQVRSEEKRLEKDFGQEYLDYKKRVGRYFPDLHL